MIYIYWILILVQVPVTGAFFKSNPQMGTNFYAAIDILFFIIFFLKHKMRLVRYILMIYPIILYMSWCFLSISWSINDNTMYNLSLIIRDIIRVSIIILMYTSYQQNIVAESIFRAVIVAAFIYGILSLLTLDYVSEYGSSFRAQYEGYRDAVNVSKQASFLCLLLICGNYLGLVKKSSLVISGLPCLIVAVLSFSKLSLSALLLSWYIAFYIIGTKRERSIKKFIYGTTIVAVTAAIIIYSRWDYITAYTSSYGGDNAASFSGRVVIWEFLIQFLRDHIVIGLGINPVYTLVQYNSMLHAGTAHNEILQQLLSYGLIGLILWTYMYAIYYKIYKECNNIWYAKSMFAIFIYYMISGTMESVLVFTNYQVYFLVFFWLGSMTIDNNGEQRKFLGRNEKF